MCRNLYIALAAAVLACSSGAAMAQSPVGNPSFDAPFLGQTAPTPGNWASFAGGPGPLKAEVDAALCLCTIVPRTGSSALILLAQSASSFVGVQQPVTGLSPGANYTMKLWSRTAGPINNPVEYRMEWRDANGTAIGDQFALTTNIGPMLTSTYQQFSLSATAPAGTAQATLVIDLQTYAFNPVTPAFDTSAYFDDVEFFLTPGQNACCTPSGACTMAFTGACPSGSTPLAADSTCTPNVCPQPVACCNPVSGFCAIVGSSDCIGLAATAGAANSTCTPNTCQPHPACRADFDGQNGLQVADIFAFLNAWFAGCP